MFKKSSGIAPPPSIQPRTPLLVYLKPVWFKFVAHAMMHWTPGSGMLFSSSPVPSFRKLPSETRYCNVTCRPPLVVRIIIYFSKFFIKFEIQNKKSAARTYSSKQGVLSRRLMEKFSTRPSKYPTCWSVVPH